MRKRERKSKIQLIAESGVYSDFLIGLAITWTAGSIGTLFITQSFDIKGFFLVVLGVFTSILCLRVAVKYKMRF